MCAKKKISRSQRREMLLHCNRLGPEDGIDPRDLARQKTAGRVKNRKALQLCAQVADILQSVLGGECADPVLQRLMVHSVQPAPSSSRLLVSVMLAPSAEDTASDEAMLALGRAAGLLRSEVAASIHRRQVPDLVFRIVAGK